jgi:hypothetical protein
MAVRVNVPLLFIWTRCLHLIVQMEDEDPHVLSVGISFTVVMNAMEIMCNNFTVIKRSCLCRKCRAPPCDQDLSPQFNMLVYP